MRPPSLVTSRSFSSGVQRIVSQGISEHLLRWKGIEATLKIAESPNSKVVVVGGKDGLPLILGAQ